MHQPDGNSGRNEGIRWRITLLALYSVQYFAHALAQAERKPLWTDEFYTLSVARQPSLGAMWDYLKVGPDLNPPLYYVLAGLGLERIASDALAIRLPAIVAFYLMLVCLYVLLSRWTGRTFAAVGVLITETTLSHSYAWEARPYTLVLALSAFSLLCWDRAESSARRALWLAAMASALAAAVSSHFLAVLIFIPIGCGELARVWRDRRVNPGVWVSVAAGLVPLLAFGPLIRNARRFTADYWSPPSVQGLINIYGLLLGRGLTILVVLAALVVVSRSLCASRTLSPPPRPALPAMVAAAALAALPAFSFALAVLATNSFTDRYSLPATMGIGIIAAVLIRDATWAQPAIGRVLVGFLLTVVVGTHLFTLLKFSRGADHLPEDVYAGVPPAVLTAPEYRDLPVVVGDMLKYMSASYVWADELPPRLVFLVGIDNGFHERSTRAFGRWPERVPATPGILEAEEFLAPKRPFLFLGTPTKALLDRLSRAQLTLKPLPLLVAWPPVYLATANSAPPLNAVGVGAR